MTLSHPPLGAFLRRLRPRYSNEYGGPAKTPRTTVGNREPLITQRKPSLLRLSILAAAIALALPLLPSRVAAQITSTLHSFSSVTIDGKTPLASLIQGTDGSFYGTTQLGGSAGYGAAFKMTAAGAITILHSFYDGSVTNDGAYPQASLIQGTDGSFYGTTQAGGSAGGGTTFKITPAGVYTLLHTFGDGSTSNDGQGPVSSLIQGTDGSFYGTTQAGGLAGYGAAFKMTAAGAVTILHSFYDGSVTNDGRLPSASLIQGSDGNFYGTTLQGGSADHGTVFKMTAAGTITILHLFGSVANDGTNPYSSLIQGSDGNFYGTTYGGGSTYYGTAFKMTAAGACTLLHTFGDGSVASDGKSPRGSLIQGSDGNFYGTTYIGGSVGLGTAFKMTSAGAVTILHSFDDGSIANDGKNPYASLVQGSDGNFYGTTSADGAGGFGTAFMMTQAGAVTTLHSFSYVTIDGKTPFASLIQGSDGNFYGTTYQGGSAGIGTVFKMTAAGVVTILHSFYDGSVANDGAYPQSGLIEGSDGNFYGTTQAGGSAGAGTAFKITPAGVYTLLHAFHDGSVTNDGANPFASLVQGSDGNFYGTTQIGGSTIATDRDGLGYGTVFKMTPAGAITILHSFYDGSVANDGRLPYASLVQGSDGNFYGTTLQGGSADHGTAFKMTPAGAITILHLFGSVANDGTNPETTLIQGSDGSFYGTTYYGGSAFYGTAFKVTPAGAYTLLHTFGDGSVANDGKSPRGSLIQGSDGNFYGATEIGGSVNLGTAFKMTSAGLVTTLHSFDDGSIANDGKNPHASLIQGSDGNFYGTTSADGAGGFGTVFIISLPANHFSVRAPATATAGSAFNVTVTALSATNSIAVTYTGTARITTTDGTAIVPADAALTNGVGTFSIIMTSAGPQAVIATDTVSSGITGTSGTITVGGADAARYLFTAPSSTTAGSAFNIGVVAQDAYGNIATGYSGTVHFTSTDGAAALPADGILTSGSGTFSATLKTVGSQTITATDTVNTSLTRTTGSIAIGVGAATHFALTTPGSATSGTAFTITVSALDAYGNTDTGYAGTVHFTSDDPTAILPADTTLTSGTGTFSVTLTKAALVTIRARDTSNASLTGTGSTTVGGAAVTHLTITCPATTNTGAANTITVSARDQYENVVKSFSDTVHFTSSDPKAVLPANSVLTNGSKSFTVKYQTPGTQSVTATDINNSSLTAMATSTVGAVATKFKITTPVTVTAGAVFPFTVTAIDLYGNTVPGYTGTVHFTSTDLTASLPSDATLTGGTGTFPATLKTVGTRTITATDTVTTTIKGASGSITVSAAAVTLFTVTAPASSTAGSAFYVIVTAKDAYGNVASGYTGTVHLSSTDPLAVLYSDAALTKGARQFAVKLKTVGTQTVKATDTASPVTGTTGSITVH